MQGGRDSPSSSQAPGNMSCANNDQVSFSACTRCLPLPSSPPTDRSPFRLGSRRGLTGRCTPGVLVASPSSCICKRAYWPRCCHSLEGRGAQGGGWQGRREGGAEVGRRERGGGRLSSAAPNLVSAGWRWLRVPLRWCSRSQPLRQPSLAREHGGKPQPRSAVGVCALKDASSRSGCCRRRLAAPARAAAASSGVPRRRC